MLTKDCNCNVSTGIHEHPRAGTNGIPYGLTFGSGECDDYGYWEYPCFDCARKAELRDKVPVNTYWPFEKQD
jgi:hypothetical protein